MKARMLKLVGLFVLFAGALVLARGPGRLPQEIDLDCTPPGFYPTKSFLIDGVEVKFSGRGGEFEIADLGTRGFASHAITTYQDCGSDSRVETVIEFDAEVRWFGWCMRSSTAFPDQTPFMLCESDTGISFPFDPGGPVAGQACYVTPVNNKQAFGITRCLFTGGDLWRMSFQGLD